MASDIIILKGKLKQGAVNAVVNNAVETGLGKIDQKTLWELVKFETYWNSAAQAGAGYTATCDMQITITRKADKFDFLDGEVIAQQRYVVDKPGGGQIQATGETDLIELPWVANSHIYFVLQAAAAAVQEVSYKLYYREKKVTELEFIKAQSGYCVC